MISLSESALQSYLLPRRLELLKYLETERGISSKVLAAMAAVDRSKFVPLDVRKRAYDDIPLDLPGMSGKASISQPSVVAHMTDLLDVQPGNHILEIGGATGYQAEILGYLVGNLGKVISFEIDHYLASSAQQRIKDHAVTNVEVRQGDGTTPQVPGASMDRLIITTSMFPSWDIPLYRVLKDGGKGVVPMGGVNGQRNECTLVAFHREGELMIVDSSETNYTFVVAQGVFGWNSLESQNIKQDNA